MNITRTVDDSFHILHINGEVDASNALNLDIEISSLLEEGVKKILVDCSRMDYISSAGLGVFMSKIESFKQAKVYFSLFEVNETVKGVFNILGLHDFINIFSTITEAKEGRDGN